MKHYAREKFSDAIHILTGPGSQRDRLYYAYVNSIIDVKRDEQVPEEVVEDVRKLHKDMTRSEREGSEGSVRVTIDEMNDQEVNAMVGRIVDLYFIIDRQEE